VTGGITRNDTNNFAFLQIRQGSSSSTSFNLAYQGTVTQTRLAYIFTDHLNTPRLIEDQSANALWRFDNVEAFGDSVANDDPNNTGNHYSFPLGLSLYYFDKEIGNGYAKQRDCYDPQIGRFCQSDPMGLNAGLNTYVYVDDDPVYRTDFFGLDSVEIENAMRAAGLQPVNPAPVTAAWSGNLSLNIPLANVRGVPLGFVISVKVGQTNSCYIGAGIVTAPNFSFAPNMTAQYGLTQGTPSTGFAWRFSATSRGLLGPLGVTGSYTSTTTSSSISAGPAVVGGRTGGTATAGYYWNF
jgi:RHS repeat-associated protein